MGVPSGEIVARPMIARACGCLQEFQHYAVDKYREQRKAKFQKTRCPACVAKLVEEQRRAATLPKKGEAFKAIPAGTQITMTRKADGTWSGTLIGDGTTVEAVGEGPQGLSLALARGWLLARGAGKESAPAPAPTPAPSPAPAKPAAAPIAKAMPATKPTPAAKPK
ncbi:MAG: hypothetical protein C0467_09810 [Planctomycetaceae bacterium]|nr:hypothetical protein [Planctomycetaceae bacterium]